MTEQLNKNKVGEVGESLLEERRAPRLPVRNTRKAWAILSPGCSGSESCVLEAPPGAGRSCHRGWRL